MEGVRAWVGNRGIDPPGVAGCTQATSPGESVIHDQRRYGRGSPRAVLPSGYPEFEQSSGAVVKRRKSISVLFQRLCGQSEGDSERLQQLVD